jgi:hypothetical protein
MAAAAIQYSYNIVVNPAGGAREIRRTPAAVGGNQYVASNIHLLNKNDCIKRFYCDVLKDSQEQPPIANIIRILNTCIPPNLAGAGPPGAAGAGPLIPLAANSYHAVLQVLETAVYNGCSLNIVEYKNILKTSTVGSNIQISDAIRVFWESGFGCRSVCRDPHMRTVKTPAATLDSLPKQVYDDLFNQHVLFDTTFTEELGFPSLFTWRTAPNGLRADESIVDICFDGGANMTVNATINNRLRNVGAFVPLVLGNKDKNDDINGLPINTPANQALNCPMIKKLLIMKEIGDVAQVWMYLAYADMYQGNYQRNQLLMVTTDSVVYLLCMLLDLSCIYTGARAGVVSGCCTLKHHLSGPIDYIARCKNMMEVYKQKVVQHNTSIAFALKIMLADPSLFDYYICHGAPPVGPVGVQHVRRVLATRGLTQAIRVLVNQMIQREINRIELANAAIEAIFVNVTKILIIIPALLPAQAAAFAAYHYFIAAAQAAAAAAAVVLPVGLAGPAGPAVAAAAAAAAALVGPAAPAALVPALADYNNRVLEAAVAVAVPAGAVPAAPAALVPAAPAALVPAGAALAAAAAVAAVPAPPLGAPAAAAAAHVAAAAAAAAVLAGPAPPVAAPPAAAALLAGRAAGEAAAKAQVAKLQALGAAVNMAAVITAVITVSTLSVVTFAAQVVMDAAAARAAAVAAAAAAGAAAAAVAAAAVGAVNLSISNTYSNFCKSIDIFKEPALFTQLPNKRYIILPGRFLNQFVGHVYAAPPPNIPQNIDMVIAGVQAAAAAANVRLYGGSRNRLQHAGAGLKRGRAVFEDWSVEKDDPHHETNFYDCLIACYVANRINPSDHSRLPPPAAADPTDAARPVGNRIAGITDFNNVYDYPDPNLIINIQENKYNIQIAFALEWDRVVNELMNEEHRTFQVNTPRREDLEEYIRNLDDHSVSDASIITMGKRLLNFVYLASDLAIETAELEKRIWNAQRMYGYPRGISAITPVQKDWVIDTRFHTWVRRGRRVRGFPFNIPDFIPSTDCGSKMDRITNKRIVDAFAIKIGIGHNEKCYDVTTFVEWLKKNDAVTLDNIVDFYTQQPLAGTAKVQIAKYIMTVYKLTDRVRAKLGAYISPGVIRANNNYRIIESLLPQGGGSGIGNTDIKRKTIKRKLHYKNRSKNQKRVNKHRITRRNNKTHRRTRKHRN